ncbi:MAG: hypothetical protein SF052_12935 [Bacteroidia bacterium]|nr:hypothetical protein [Bacteroidia bacterium]
MKGYNIVLFFLLWAGMLRGQNTDIVLNHDLYHYTDRLDIKGLTGSHISTDIKPYSREMLAEIFSLADTGRMTLAEAGWHTRMRMLADDTFAIREQFRGVGGTFYTNHRDLFHVAKPGFRLFLNPVIHFAGGVDHNDYSNASKTNLPIYVNSRGLVLRGSFREKLGFYTEVYDNVTRLPQFVFNSWQTTQTLHGEAFIKRFGQENGVDYFSSRAYVTYSPWKQMRIKFGKDRAFWGNGYQSLLLSDHAADYLMLNINTRIWKLVYTNHFTQMIHFIRNRNDNDGILPRKYGVFHQLTWYPASNLSFSIFESVIYSPIVANGRRGFELQYLNPIIFYRAAEQYIGSPDNSLLGLQFKYNFLRRVQFYGQILLDDYNFGIRDQGSGYWGNKLGFQGGAKYVDVLGISNLDIQLEYNRIRPYTYQHFSVISNYSNYGQYLGHAAGANLENYFFSVRYHPFPAWNILLTYTRLQKGLDEGGINYGGDLSVPDINRPGDFNNFVGQGKPWKVSQIYGRLSWQLKNTDIYAELEGRYRTENENTSTSFLGGIRVNILPREVKF